MRNEISGVDGGPPIESRSLVETAALVVLATVIVGILHTGRELLVPLTLAVLLSFVLAPLVLLLRRIALPRGLAVVTAVLAAFAILFALGWLITAQVSQLVQDLPRYQETIQQKISSLKGPTAASGALEQVSLFLDSVARDLDGAVPTTPGSRPLPVQVLNQAPGPLSKLVALFEPLLHSFAMTGIVVIFVIFILLQREDLRNRFIKLVGTRDLQKTTAALDDAARRLSKLLLIQLALNTAFGVVVGVGLWLIGVPIPVLWGILAAALRFVPYIGALIALAPPLALAAAVDPGWSMLLMTGALFLVTEPIIGHFIEPVAFGRTTGLSPVAVVVAATFWTWLWGPIGLVLATPLTVCLVVLGRHVKGLSFLEVLLGDRPALSPPEMFYQRALAGDSVEIVAVAEEVLSVRSLDEYYDQIAAVGLRLAADDVGRGLLSQERAARIRATIEDVVDDLDDYPAGQPADAADDAEVAYAIETTLDTPEAPVLTAEQLRPEWRGERSILAIGADGPLDHACAEILASLLGKHGLAAAAEGPETLTPRGIFSLDARNARLVFLVALGTAGAPQLRQAVRRLRRRHPAAELVLVVPAAPAPPVPDAVGGIRVVTAFIEAVALAVAAAGVEIDAAAAAAAAEPGEQPSGRPSAVPTAGETDAGASAPVAARLALAAPPA